MFFIKRELCVIALLALLVSVGCRKAPSDSPKYYESELNAMRRQELKGARVTKPLKDGYPWEGRKPAKESLSERILRQERICQQEIDYLHTTVHGKKKTRLRLRD